MSEKIFQVQCKFCGQIQKALTRRESLVGSKQKYVYSKKKDGPTTRTLKEIPIYIYKKCVYCEKRFIIHHHAGKSQILRGLK